MSAPPPEIALLQELVRCPSVTPAEGGALDLLESRLKPAGFACTRLPFGEGDARVDNLFAVWGEGGRHFGFAGHTDVVPPGDAGAWTHDPFGGVVEDGFLYGRGAVDMKGGVAAFVAAVLEWIEAGADPGDARVSLLITGDEEAEAVNGTKPVLEWIDGQGLMADAFLVGEPTNPEALGDVIKHGRRGSLCGELVVHGSQGHSANPQFADNPMPRLLRMLAPLTETEIDGGNEHFGPSTAAITSIDTGNPARNVTPASTTAKFNIRFNSEHTAESLIAWLTGHFESVAAEDGGGDWTVGWLGNADPFVTEPGPFTDLLAGAVEEVTGRKPELSTSGGTSDARFIADYAPVAEFGLVGRTMHKVDERTATEDVTRLKAVYRAILDRFFMADLSRGGPG